MKNAMAPGRGLTRAISALFCLGISVIAVPVSAAEYFVNKQGNNANKGASRERAFLTVQKGVDALNPGDTLTIAPGEYFENVRRANLGGPDADTVIRAEIPGTVLLRGDVPAPEFKKVEGYRFVYAAPFDKKPQAVLEHNELYTLLSKANVAELEFDPGAFYYDADSRMLYISNPDLGNTGRRRYTLGVGGKSGIDLDSPRRVVIDGLGATGFHPRYGIWLKAPVSCTIRNCILFLNVKGIELSPIGGSNGADCGSDNLIENCVCYGNRFSGISRYTARNDVIRNCRTYKNTYHKSDEDFGIMHYHDSRGSLLIRDNISWGQKFDFSVKPSTGERLENCVGLGYVRNAPGNMSHNLIGGGNEYDRRSVNAPAETILFLRERKLDRDFEFADPLNLDFRLQSDSRFRGTAPDESDRGAYQYKANIFYVSPTGNDRSDGLSMRKPWRTLNRALRRVRPGDTLYLTEGKYAGVPLNKVGDGEEPIRILGRGRGTVVITNELTLAGCAGIVFQRLNFARGMSLSNSRDVTLRNCTFFGPAGGLKVNRAENLRVTHSVFAGVPVDVNGSSGVFLSGNIYANAGKPAVELDAVGAIRYSDYNNYQDKAQCWKVRDTKWSFASLQRRHDHYSQTLKSELAVKEGAPRVKDDNPFKSIGPFSTALGIHHEYDATREALELAGPFLHSTSDTTANIEWWVSRPATYSLSWGETPQMKNTVNYFRSAGRFSTYSLTGLKPGRRYYFRIVSADASNRQKGILLPVLRPKDKPLTFETASRPARQRVYYVASDGSDDDDGLSRRKAFRTISRAAARVGPGDTVMIAAGKYNETVRLRAAGTRERPITFRCMKGEEVVHWAENLSRSFEVVVKPDNRFDGLYFRGMTWWREGFVVHHSPRVQITRCFMTMVVATHSPEVLIRNCVLHGGWSSVDLSNCPGSVVENNVFVMTILRQLQCNCSIIARRNIFCESFRNKTHQKLLDLSPKVKESDNCFYLRWPVEEKLAVNNMPLPVYRVRTGSNAFAANPMMPGVPGRSSGWQKYSEKDFDEYFSANPKLVLRDIGLQPEAFRDFKVGVKPWPYDQPWAREFVRAYDAAGALPKAGKDAQALTTYVELVKKMPMCDRLKADVLGKASLCAERLKEYERAMQLAKSIPAKALSIRRQMQLMLAQKKYAALIASFAERNMGGVSLAGLTYPELEDLIEDLHYYRSIAYRKTGDLAAAEADLMCMIKKHRRNQYRAGESIQDLAYLRLGDFYRESLKDDTRALEAYLKVCERTTWSFWGNPPKPVSTGAGDTLVKATSAACEILRKQGNLIEVKKRQADMKEAQAKAAAALEWSKPSP